MTKIAGRRQKKGNTCSDPGCGALSSCDCSLFSMLLTVGAAAARVIPAPVADGSGRAAILGYRRWLSHRWPGQCRFTPTCSAYGLTAVERYGLAVGGRMAAGRLRRCTAHTPPGTHDPVPAAPGASRGTRTGPVSSDG
ncbi:membrane protein insertion efficiency factor YidD [Micromonospora sp. NPDC049903]|uniref:membrane protein insertion efficiency factor YidD n=1 Tax=Micromonospora sp. NPDC049903 TaxID=3364276 RepID=UPI0037AF6081